jgi:hypothetical protein
MTAIASEHVNSVHAYLFSIVLVLTLIGTIRGYYRLVPGVD